MKGLRHPQRVAFVCAILRHRGVWEARPRCGTCRDLIPSRGEQRATVSMDRSVCPSVSWRTSGVFPPLGCSERSCCKCFHTSPCMDIRLRFWGLPPGRGLGHTVAPTTLLSSSFFPLGSRLVPSPHPALSSDATSQVTKAQIVPFSQITLLSFHHLGSTTH